MGEIFDIFKLNKAADWGEIKRTLSDDRIRHMYQVVADLWHYRTDICSLLPKPDNTLRALYLGGTAPDLLVKSVFRFSLYADEILIVSPFMNPWCVRSDYNPIERPSQYRFEALKLVYFALQMFPWVDAGLVHLVPDPGDFDYGLKATTWKMAEERVRRDPPTDEDLKDELLRTEEEVRRQWLASPDEYFVRKLRESNPNVTDDAVHDYLTYVQSLRDSEPFITSQTLDHIGPQMTTKTLGANLEMALYLCQMTGAFPYTNVQYRWKELLSVRDQLPPDAETWMPLTKAFQGVNFKFLDAVDTTFACNLRKEERLAGFRTYLRRLWSTVNIEDDMTKLQAISRQFADELTHEYGIAEAEWERIDKDLIKWLGGSIATGIAAGTVGAMVNGTLGIAAGAPFVIKGVTELLTARLERRAFRKKIPMSVFVDLKRNA